MKQKKQVREWNPDIKIVLSIVPEEPDAFTVVSASEELRGHLTEACRKLVAESGFDGVDFDWEYPCVPSNGMNCSPADRENFTLLCEAARKGMDAAGGGIVSIAAGADLYYIESIEVDKLAKILDYVCLMTYDLKCGFHALSGHHTALYSSTGDIFRNSCDQALRLFHQAGFPKEMLLQPLSSWSYPERLRFSYYRWYLLNPRLLICFFPFAGQESTHHKMIIDMLLLCARRGMAVWIISSGIDAICEKTDNEEFLRRLRYIKE